MSGLGFQLTGSSGPIQIPAGAQYSFAVIFNPVLNGGTQQGTLTLTLPSGAVPFSLAGTGTSTSFAVSYALADGNARSLTDGTTITFPNTNVNGTSTANLTLLNPGTGSGVVNSISLSGTGFRLSGVPLLPATVAAGQNLQFGIVFAPSQTGTFNGTFHIDVSGRSISGAVTGSTTTPNFSTTYVFADGVVTSLSSGSTISFPAVDINATTTASMEIANQGTGPGEVSAITVSGTGFRLTSTPALPANVAAGQSLRFGIVFAPTRPGSYSGAFRIDLPGRSVSGNLAASTATSTISLAYVEPDTNNVVALHDGATMPFPKTASGSSSSVTLVVANSGPGTGVIDSAALNTTSASVFQLLNMPALPASVAPSRQLTFAVRFSPRQQQSFSGRYWSVSMAKSPPLTCKLRARGRNSRTATGPTLRRLPPAARLQWAMSPLGRPPG